MKLWIKIYNDLKKHPHQTIEDGNVKMTYAEFLNKAIDFSTKIVGEKCCGIYCDSEIYTAIAIVGCIAAGVTALPLSKRYGKTHCEKILKAISPSCVVSDIYCGLDIIRISDSSYIPPDAHPTLIMCTSGTTGIPKGIMLSEDNILSNVTDIEDYFEICEEDSILIARPLYHCAVLTGEFLVSIAKGLRIVFYSSSFVLVNIEKIIERESITTFCATPTIIKLIANFAKNEMKNRLKNIVISGECLGAIDGRIIRNALPNVKIYHVYGLTEASPRVCYLPPEYFDDAPDYVGVPLKSVKVEIRNDKGELVNVNDRGLLWVFGPNVTTGYYNDPNLTKKYMSDGWLCTGDIAQYNEHGWIKILGRCDNLIVRAGMNIYPSEIENELKKDDRVRDVYIYTIDDPKMGIQIGMKIAGNFNNIKEIKKLCTDLLPLYQVPSKIELFESLPTNGSGKILRKVISDD